MVRGAKLRAVLDGEGSQMGISGEVPSRTQGGKQLAQYLEVSCSGLGHYDARLLQPRVDQVEGNGHGKRLSEEAGSGGKAKECKQNAPRQADSFGSGNDGL